MFINLNMTLKAKVGQKKCNQYWEHLHIVRAIMPLPCAFTQTVVVNSLQKACMALGLVFGIDNCKRVASQSSDSSVDVDEQACVDVRVRANRCCSALYSSNCSRNNMFSI